MAILPTKQQIEARNREYEERERKKLGNPEKITKWVEGVKGRPNYAKNFERMWKQMPQEKKIEFLRREITRNKTAIDFVNRKDQRY